MKNRSRLGYHAAEIAFAVVLIVWYVLPYFSPSLGGFNPLQLAAPRHGSPPREPGRGWSWSSWPGWYP